MAMSEVAGLIGSDVPFCLEGGTALATARGEKLSPLPAPDKVWFVLGLSSVSLLTKDVYEAFDEMDSAPESSPSSMTLALGSGDVPEIAECLHNDLERAAFAMRPELAEKKRALLGAGALGAGMSGSGPTLFAIARDEGHARTIAAGVEDSFPSVVVTCSRATCIERLA
jgi:4-diphosphocytidyl-2-C-methyl-D-erythritol kinase